MATGESIGHMTDDVIWPRKVKVVTRYRKMQISRKRWEIEVQYPFTTNIKCHMGNRMDTWPVTSRDPISRKRLEIHTWSQWSTYRKWLLGIHWSHDRWRHMTPKGQGRDPDIRKCKYLAKRWQIEAQYQLTTNRKWHMAKWMHTWPMTSRDLEINDVNNACVVYIRNYMSVDWTRENMKGLVGAWGSGPLHT